MKACTDAPSINLASSSRYGIVGVFILVTYFSIGTRIVSQAPEEPVLCGGEGKYSKIAPASKVAAVTIAESTSVLENAIGVLAEARLILPGSPLLLMLPAGDGPAGISDQVPKWATVIEVPIDSQDAIDARALGLDLLSVLQLAVWRLTTYTQIVLLDKASMLPLRKDLKHEVQCAHLGFAVVPGAKWSNFGGFKFDILPPGGITIITPSAVAPRAILRSAVKLDHGGDGLRASLGFPLAHSSGQHKFAEILYFHFMVLRPHYPSTGTTTSYVGRGSFMDPCFLRGSESVLGSICTSKKVSQSDLSDSIRRPVAEKTLERLRRQGKMTAHERRIVLVHVPRSGGRSIECTFGRYKFARNSAFRADQAVVSGGKDLLMCCGAHAGLDALYAAFGPNSMSSRYAVFFRDPGTRIISAIRHDVNQRSAVHSRVTGSLQRKFVRGSVTIDDYITAPDSEKHVNHAVAMLSGAGAGTRDRRDLNLAIARLLHFDVMVGIFERYSDSLMLWSAELGITPFTDVLSCSNSVQNKHEETQAQLAAIREQHSLDTELYRFASGLFLQRWYKSFGKAAVVNQTRLECEATLRGCLHTRSQDSSTPAEMGRAGDEIICWKRCHISHDKV